MHRQKWIEEPGYGTLPAPAEMTVTIFCVGHAAAAWGKRKKKQVSFGLFSDAMQRQQQQQQRSHAASSHRHAMNPLTNRVEAPDQTFHYFTKYNITYV